MFAADHGRGASGTSGDARQFPDVLLPVALWIEKESIYDSTERQHQLVQK